MRPKKETPLTIEQIRKIARAPIPIFHNHIYRGKTWGGAMPLPDDTTPRHEYDAWRQLRSQHHLPTRNDEESGE